MKVSHKQCIVNPFGSFNAFDEKHAGEESIDFDCVHARGCLEASGLKHAEHSCIFVGDDADVAVKKVEYRYKFAGKPKVEHCMGKRHDTACAGQGDRVERDRICFEGYQEGKRNTFP